MFTGLIEALGTVRGLDEQGGARRLRIETALGDALREGDSIAVNGVCLTVTAADPAGFAALVSPETLRVTAFAGLQVGRRVNLERPLRADGRFGGHFVLGHVDAVGSITGLDPQGDSYWLEVDVPDEIARVTVSKGSIAIDGISLTVAAIEGARIGVQIVPFTFDHTTLGAARVGDPVNLEADVIGKYVARLVDARLPSPQTTAGRGV